MDKDSQIIWLAVALLAAVAAIYVYTAFAAAPVTSVSVDSSILVYVAAVALAAFTVKQAIESRSNLSHHRTEDLPPSRMRSGGSAGSATTAGSGGTRELVDETETRFGSPAAGSAGMEGDDSFGFVGSEFDELVRASVDYEVVDESRNQARQQVVEELREVAAYSVSRRMEIELESAERKVVSGDWTDAPRAAALLSDDSGPDLPWRCRLLDLLAGRDIFLSSVDEAVEEIRTKEET